MKNFARSLAIHAVIVSLVLLFGAAVHKVVPTRAHYSSVLVLPMDLPVPTRRPITLRAQGGPVAFKVSTAPALLRANPEAAPSPVKMDTSSSLALPQIAQRTVTAAPVARQVGFGSPAPTASRPGGAVSQTGFGSGYAQQGGAGYGNARVVAAGFDTTPAPATVPAVAHASTQRPVIVSEPTPIYTETARAARISGTVVLRVRFTAEGSVKVLGVLQGLGYGLDEEAIRTAESIRFTPAARDGQAVAFETFMHVSFQLP